MYIRGTILYFQGTLLDIRLSLLFFLTARQQEIEKLASPKSKLMVESREMARNNPRLEGEYDNSLERRKI